MTLSCGVSWIANSTVLDNENQWWLGGASAGNGSRSGGGGGGGIGGGPQPRPPAPPTLAPTHTMIDLEHYTHDAHCQYKSCHERIIALLVRGKPLL